MDIKAHLDDADSVVDALPWKLGDTEQQRRRARGRVASLAHHVASLLARGWSVQEIRTALADAPGAAEAADVAAQEKRWRSALKRAKSMRPAATAAAAYDRAGDDPAWEDERLTGRA